MTRIEFATSLISRAAAWARQDYIGTTGGRSKGMLRFDHVEILLMLARRDGFTHVNDLRAPGEKDAVRVGSCLVTLTTRGYVEADSQRFALTDKGKAFVNSILK